MRHREEQQRIQAEHAAKAQAAQTSPLAAGELFRIRIQLHDGTFFEAGVNCSWPDWIHRLLHVYHGVAHDRGFIPLHAIKFIVHLDSKGEVHPDAGMSENVVPFKRPS